MSKFKEAAKFAESVRGQFILSQALTVAAEAMKQEPYPESSNIADMEYLRDNLFPLYKAVSDSHSKAQGVLLND